MSDDQAASLEIVRYTGGHPERPWYIRINTGVPNGPALVFPFCLAGIGSDTDLAVRSTERAAQAALHAAWAYYRVDDTCSFMPVVQLLNQDQEMVRAFTTVTVVQRPRPVIFNAQGKVLVE